MKIPLPLRTLVLVTPVVACSQPAANGLLCSDRAGCPAGFQCYTTSAMQKRCFDRPIFPTCSPGAVLCEDFEGPLAGWYAIDYNNSTLRLDAMHAHTGDKSLHTGVRPRNLAAPPPNNLSQAQVTQPVSIAPDIFMRFFLYQSSTFPNSIEIAALQENRGDYRGATLWFNTGKLEVDAPDAIPDEATPAELIRVGDRPLPENEWICLEWQIHAGTAGELRVWVNDQEQTELYLAADTSLVVPASGEGTVVLVGLGLFTDDAAPFSSYDVWFDDITVSPHRIYCD